MYVIQKNTANNSLIVGTADELGQRALVARQVTYISGQPPPAPIRVKAKIRYKSREVEATLTPLPRTRAQLIFDIPLRDITPGQAVVFFEGEQVLGGGIIE
jgi:tRNA-specific 2-thiouridylase